jgi:Zn-dependent M28 family amino/carboxypeptidase
LRHIVPISLLLGAALASCSTSMQGEAYTVSDAVKDAAKAEMAEAKPEISKDTLVAITKELSSDAYEGRAPGSAGEAKTIDLIAKRFAAAGLKPGNKGSWYQDVPIVEITANPAMQLKISGGKTPIALNYKSDFVVGTYRQSEKIDIAKSEMVFVGYGINAPERGWNDYAGVDVKGKTVVILINDPDYETEGLNGTFNGRAMTYYGRWTYKYEEAARQGAAAAIIVHDTFPAAYPWGVVVSSWTGPQVHIDLASKGMDQTLANGWMTNEAAQKLMAASGKDLAALSAAAKKPGFKAVPLGMTADLSFTNSMSRSLSKNVIGVLPGKKRPNETVLFSAHWDHLGRCEAIKGDDICNGALDNATGTAGLIALAEAHGKMGATDRSLVFLAVTAEESGLLGSKYYAENPIYPLNTTAGGVNMDGLNVFGRTRDITVIGKGQSNLETMLDSEAQKQGRILMAEPTPEKGSYYRSDHFSFAKFGVPMLYFDSGEDMIEGGKEAGRRISEDYITNRYHKPQDEFDPNWNWDGAVEDLLITFALGRHMGNGKDWPAWNAGSEFKSIRDKSAVDRK